MNRSAQVLACGLLLAGTALSGGCSSGASGLITGSAPTAADMPGGIGNDSPAARPVAVAWTSARAQRCGFHFDAAKLRASYLAYEARQSNGEQLTKSEQSYDTTFKVIRDRVAADPDYCSDKKGAEIKADLQRHLKGDFTPNFPKAKVVESCGFFGCTPAPSDEKFDNKKFFEERDKKNIGR